MREKILRLSFFLLAGFSGLAPCQTMNSGDSIRTQNPEGEISLPQALSLTLLHNPELAAYAWEVRAAEATRLQAGLRVNPEISLDVEDFAGSGNHSGLEGSQTTLQISQRFELGGKRSAREKAASFSVEKTRWEYEAKRLEILKKTSQAYVEAVAAQRGFSLAEEGVQLAGRMAETVSLRAKAGKAGAGEESKAKVASASARIEWEWANHRLEGARKNLVALWGDAEPRFQSAKDFLDSATPLPLLESVIGFLDQNPEMARFSNEIAREEAVLKMEKTQAIPDLTIRGGYRRLSPSEDNALVAGVSIPLPFANRNQGRILEANQKIAAARKQSEAMKILLRGRLAEAVKVAHTSQSEIALLKGELLPGAESAFQNFTQGYQLGRNSFLEVLDAQKTLTASRLQHLRALTEFHRAVAEIESLIGRPLNH